MRNNNPGAGRQYLASSTKAVHQALHQHRLMSRLLAPDLSIDEYSACLKINLCFFHKIEAARAKCAAYERFSLQHIAQALTTDLADMADQLGRTDLADARNFNADLTFDASFDHDVSLEQQAAGALESWRQNHVLGALYVAHGSQFGRQVMAKAVARSLPFASKAYLSLQTNMTNWHALENVLDDQYQSECSFFEVEQGASQAFVMFEQLADFYADQTYRVGTGMSLA